MEFKPIKKRRVYHEIIEQMMSAIKRGEIQPGDRLPSERILAEHLAVSRTTIKEAISVMESSGVVMVKPGVGTFLKEFNTHDILNKLNSIIHNEIVNIVELMEIRQAIEGDAAYYAAMRRTYGDLIELKMRYDELEASVNKGNLAAKEDFEFHMTVLKISKNHLMVNVMDLLSERLKKGLEESRAETLQNHGRTKIVLEEHRIIYKAIQVGDGEAARTAMWNHLQNVKQRFI